MRERLTFRRDLRRTLLVCHEFEPAQARRIVGALLASLADDSGSKAWHAHWEKRKPVIAAVQAKIVKQLRFARAEVLRAIEHDSNLPQTGRELHAAEGQGGAAADLMFDRQTFGNQLAAAIRKASAEALQTAGDQFQEEEGIDDDPFRFPPKAAKEFLDGRANKLADVPDEIYSSIKDELQAGLDAGDSHAELSKRVAAAFGQVEESRAQTIASTEVSACYGVSRDQAMHQAGITRKKWLTSGLDTVRATHQEAEGQIRGIDEPFDVGGEELMYPGDEDGSAENVINCHCVAVGLDDEGADEGELDKEDEDE